MGHIDAYIWDTKQGVITRFVQDTIVSRLIRDGYVTETKRTFFPNECCLANSRSFDSVWKVVYRTTKEDEDQQVQAYHNQERETIHAMLQRMQEGYTDIHLLQFRSDSATQIMESLQEAVTLATHFLTQTGKDLFSTIGAKPIISTTIRSEVICGKCGKDEEV